MKVTARRTTLEPEEVRRTLTAAWLERFGVAPLSDSVSVLLAQIAQETGFRACWNFNLGNVKASAAGSVADAYDYCELEGVWEIENGARVDLIKGAPGTQFRAFATLDEGAAFYLATLFRHFAAAWPAVVAGDPLEFAVALKRAHYYTAPLEDYARGLSARFEELREPPLHTQAQIAAALERVGYEVEAGGYPDAVKQFQADHPECGNVDGIVGPKTRRALRTAIQVCA